MANEQDHQPGSGASDDSLEALTEKLGATFSQYFSPSGEAERSDAERAREEDEDLQDLRRTIINATIEAIKGGRRKGGNRAEHAVRTFCDRAKKETLRKLDADERMPSQVPYKRIVVALSACQDRSILLHRIDQTLSKAEEQIVQSQSADPAVAVRDASGHYLKRLRALAGVKVAEADDSRESQLLAGSDAELRRKLDSMLASSLEEFETSITGEFAATMGEDETAEALDGSDIASRTEDVYKQAITALDNIESKTYDFCRKQAHEVQGQPFYLDEPPLFEGASSVKRAYDLVDVALFSKEARKAFATYRQIVQDRGIFAAFPDYEGESEDDKSYGVDDFDFEDDPKVALEHLREMEQHEYGGILDDEFGLCVDAFWYGFNELIRFANGMVVVDLSEFTVYLARVENDLCARAFELGLRMDAGQLDAFEKDVKKLQRKAR